MTKSREGRLNTRVVIFILFLAALVIRLIALKQNYVIAQDGTMYIKMAQLYSVGEYHHELFRNYAYYSFFPILLLPFHKIFGDWILAGQWVSTLSGALTVIPLYLLARRLFDEKIALWGTIFYSLCPAFVQFSAEVLRDIPFVFFYTTALWWGYKGIEDEKLFFVALSSFFIAIATSLRIEGLALLVALTLFLFWHRLKNDISWKKQLITFGVLWASVFCIFSFFGLILNQKGIQLGKIQIKALKSVMSLNIVENQTIKSIENEVEKTDISQTGKDFFALAKKYRSILYLSHFCSKTVEGFNILFLFFLFGLIKRRKIRYRQGEFLLFFIYAVFLPIYFISLKDSNYLATRRLFAILVPSFIWCGVGFVEFRERIIWWMKSRDFPLKAYVVRWLTPILLFVICVPLLAMAWAPQRKDKLELKNIGLWLRDHGYAHSAIMGEGDFGRLAFYADSEFIELPKGSYQDIIRFAREKKADLLVIDQETIDQFSPLFLEKITPKDLQRINIPDIKTPKYATAVFLIKSEGERQRR
jgi:4-amino-4-deoxy-L-arabinose transferase-like glycosyltransferase